MRERDRGEGSYEVLSFSVSSSVGEVIDRFRALWDLPSRAEYVKRATAFYLANFPAGQEWLSQILDSEGRTAGPDQVADIRQPILPPESGKPEEIETLAILRVAPKTWEHLELEARERDMDVSTLIHESTFKVTELLAVQEAGYQMVRVNVFTGEQIVIPNPREFGHG